MVENQKIIFYSQKHEMHIFKFPSVPRGLHLGQVRAEIMIFWFYFRHRKDIIWAKFYQFGVAEILQGKPADSGHHQNKPI